MVGHSNSHLIAINFLIPAQVWLVLISLFRRSGGVNFTPDFHESGVCPTKYILIKGNGVRRCDLSKMQCAFNFLFTL